MATLNLTEGHSVKTVAAAYAAAKPATRKALRAYVAERITRKVAWKHLLADIDAGDIARIKARAMDGTAKTAEFKRIREAEKAAKPAQQPKAAPKPAKAAKAAPAKAEPKAPTFDPAIAKAMRDAGFTAEDVAAALLKLTK